ncbi:MAG TPA: hypothetical protein VGE50_11175 [Gammaproteobacteria bacterium]
MTSPILLRRLPALLLLLTMLLSQWGWITHEYKAHDNGQVCELCVAGAQLGHGLTGALQLSSDFHQAPLVLLAAAPLPLTTTGYTPLQPRAPPLHLV